ncbi:MAG: DUF488 domain-containing protein [Candidatus Sulfotelmatobacter sp.]
MTVFTIGFTKKTARDFFSKLKQSGARRLIDVRLNNVSQLAGFAKKDDLRYFLEAICQMEYLHIPSLAPTQSLLDAYKKKKGDWSVYEDRFLALMRERHIEDTILREELDGACLLCSEETPDHCHRRLVAEYLRDKWGNLEIKHIV